MFRPQDINISAFLMNAETFKICDFMTDITPYSELKFQSFL